MKLVQMVATWFPLILSLREMLKWCEANCDEGCSIGHFTVEFQTEGV
ncbi:hypothetical protein FuraDRAFT_0627 [Pseudogulbenkiania ferrooxidans 2002]|uniref:Uncharacterized protein n=1 Tax=Pseudogulbenkiania ferrooxidans 2002 TaxID=279714 RepID=B9Z0K5_9NEIS|nr:hypothetical protein FuraDRAFT_0627 [Pseudogulbenkiania ferrooxidans 2002]